MDKDGFVIKCGAFVDSASDEVEKDKFVLECVFENSASDEVDLNEIVIECVFKDSA